PELEAHLPIPREAMAHHRAERRRNRRPPLAPSQRQHTRKARPKRAPGECYNTRSYYHAVLYGIRQANSAAEKAGKDPIPSWHVNQLRHNAATRLRKEFGLDVARVILGHSSPPVTEVYAEVDMIKGMDAMARIG